MRLYRALLRLYPASFRNEYGDELSATFAARTADDSPVRRMAAAFADVVPSAIAAHWDILRADLRDASRALRRSPAFAVTAILVVALGVGANTAAFSIADYVLLRPLPFPEPARLVKIWETTPGYGAMELSPGNYRDWKASARSFSGMGAYTPTAVNLTGAGEPQRLQAASTTIDVLPTLGARPLMGRTFTAADTVDGRAVIISYDLWQTQFGADPSVIGRHVELNGVPHAVVGVMPATFHFPQRGIDIWRPLFFAAEDFQDRTNNFLQVVGRLAPGVTLEQAGSELRVIAGRLEKEFPDNADTGAAIFSLSDEVSERGRVLILALCGAALCVLLLACANLANLLIARSAARERELAVRTALGAGRERIIRQIVTESMTLAVLGGVAGVLVAIAAVPALNHLVPQNLPIAEQPGVDLRVLAFATAVVLITALAFSIVPALRASRIEALGSLREDARSGGGRQRVRSALVVVEVMASVVLLISSGLLVRAIWRLQAVDPGFRAENTLTLRTALPWPRYADPRDRQPFYDEVLRGVSALPGVESAAYISFLPMTMRGGIWPVIMRGDEAVRSAANSASLRYATPRIFDALGIPLRAGRAIDATDRADSPPTAVVSESFAQRYWPNEPALGKRFKIAFKERTVVGIVGNVRVRGLEQQSEPQVYLPYQQQDSGSLTNYTPQDLVIRSTAAPEVLLPAIRRIVRAADPLQPVSAIRTMEEVVANETASRAAQLRVLSILAGVALLLSAIGIHGLLSFTVSRRSREIGVRMALGAQSAQVRRMILREGAVLAIAGVVPGVAIAYAAGRGMQSLLAGVAPGDVPTFAAATALCVVATLVGCAAPAFRASRVDPISVIRAD